MPYRLPATPASRGVLGRKPKLTPHQIREVLRRRHIHGESLIGIAKTFNVNHTTIMRIVAAACVLIGIDIRFGFAWAR